MKTHYRFALLLSAALFLGAASGFAQDYNGVLAPETGKEKADGPGYEGLIPGPVPKKSTPAPQKEPAVKADSDEEQDAAPETAQTPTPAPQPQVTYAPGYKPKKVETVEDIEAVAGTGTIPDFKFDASGLPAGLADKMMASITPAVKQGLAAPRMRLEGMLPEEYTAKQDIDSLLRTVANPHLTTEQRRARAHEAEQELLLTTKAMEARQGASQWVYTKMDIPAVYVSEENESQAHTLARLKSAIDVLKQYEIAP